MCQYKLWSQILWFSGTLLPENSLALSPVQYTMLRSKTLPLMISPSGSTACSGPISMFRIFLHAGWFLTELYPSIIVGRCEVQLLSSHLPTMIEGYNSV